MGEILIEGGEASEETWTGEHCFITELMNDSAIPEVSLAQCRVSPGTTTQLHKLSVKEWYVVAKGSGLMEIGAAPRFKIGPGDTVAIPAGTSQRVTNIGDSDLLFQCVCIPRFTPECYESLDTD